MLRRAEGVPIRFSDGGDGIVDEVIFGPLGFDFWPVALVVATAGGRRRVSTAAIRRIDVRQPRLFVSASSPGPLERGGRVGNERGRHVQHLDRVQRRHDLAQERVPPRRHRQQAEAAGGGH
ncbi:MAG: hypothetical protein ACRDM1_08250 [Gaiellaceae bacterium]